MADTCPNCGKQWPAAWCLDCDGLATAPREAGDATLRERIVTLTEALRFYAEVRNHSGSTRTLSAVERDHGRRAREALARSWRPID